MEKKKIFISSCKSMLTKERKNLRSILYQNEHLLPICMEKDFLSDNSTSPLDVDKQYIEDSDAVICILSFLYGELIGKKIENIELCPLKEFKCKNCCCSGKNPICTISFTEFEYHYAKKLGKLVYVIYNEELDNNNAFEDHIKRYKEKEDYLRNMYNNHKEKNMVFLNTAKQNFCYHYESKKSFRENCYRVVSLLIDRFGIEKKNHAIEKRQISKHLSGHLNKQNFKREEKYFDELA